MLFRSGVVDDHAVHVGQQVADDLEALRIVVEVLDHGGERIIAIVLAAGIAGIALYLMRSRAAAPNLNPLTAEEKARIAELLGEERQG